MKKRIMALFLCICMIMSLMPSAFAETAEEESVSAEASLINTDDAAEVCAETDKEADTEVKTEEAEEQLDYFEETVGIERNTFRPVEIKTESFKYINPIYADMISENDIPDAEINESDLDALKLRVSGTQTLALDYELSDIASAGAEVRRGLVARNSSVSVNYLFSGDITNDQLQQLVFGIFNEALKHTGNPVEGDYILYQLGGYSVEIAYSDEHFLITYEIAYYTSPEQESEMNSAVAAALAEMQLDGMSNYEKLHTIYRYICKNVDYNNAMNDIPLQFTGYAALVKGLAVCQGYSVLLYRLCLSEGIDARIVDSKNMNHSWNIVSMGGKYYALDATWDSNFDDNDTQYMYFMKGSNYWLANHVVGGISELGVQYNDGAFAAYYAIAEEDFSPTNIIASGNCGKNGDNVTWTLDENGTLTISGEGEIEVTSYPPTLPWQEYKSDIKAVIIEDGIENIPKDAFDECTELESVSIADSVTSIFSGAFYGCTSLKSVELPENLNFMSVGTFMNCTALESIVLPEKLTNMGAYTFKGCTSLETVTMQCEEFVSIGQEAFSGCTALKTVNLPEKASEDSWGIAEGAFYNCTSLKSITLPEGLKEIGDSAFENCDSLEYVNIPASVTYIGMTTFKCSSLTDVYYGGTEAEWNEKDFGEYFAEGVAIHFTENNIIASGECGKDGDNLTWTLDENGVLTISGEGEMANFDFASSPWYEHRYDIKTAVISEGITSICSYAFSDCSSLTSIEIPDSVTSIGNYTFSGCSSLTSIVIPCGVTSIGWSAFSGCSSLTSIAIPNSVTSIGNFAFSGCSSLNEIIVSDTNNIYSSIDGVLYSKDKTELIMCPNGKEGQYTIPDSVTSIGDSAFSSCSSLTSIAIPDSVTSIGYAAFSDCSSLNEIIVSDTNNIYSSIDGVLYSKDKTELIMCPNGKEGQYTIPDSVTSIGDIAFSGCSSLTSIVIPGGVTSIGWGAFSGCSSLTSIEIPNSVTIIGNSMFYNCSSLTSIAIPDSVTCIDIGAFSGCSSLTSIAIPDSVTSIGNYAFIGCDSLTDVYYGGTEAEWNEKDFGEYFNEGVTIHFTESNIIASGICGENLTWELDADGTLTISGTSEMAAFDFASSPWYEYRNDVNTAVISDGVTSIGDYAFSGCSSLTSIEIPDSVTSIGWSAFSGCSSLTSIAIPNSVTSIGIWAFSECSSLNEIIVSDANNIYSSIDGVLYSKDKTELIMCPNGKEGQYTIPDSVTNIGSSAFYGCSSLTSIEIPNSVTSIGFGVFEYCSSLASIEIPDSVTSIGDDAFWNCSSLTSIEIPNSVTIIGNSMFYNCSSLTSIAIPDSVTSIGGSAFSDCSSLTSIVIPSGVTSIGDWAFVACRSLTSIVIPDSVTSIGNYAFDGCRSLSDVYYGGTEDEWTEITIGSYNDDLINARIHFIGPNFSIVPSITVTDNNTTTAEVDSAHVDDLVSAGIEKVHIDVTDTTAENVTVNIPANAVDTIANNNMPVQLDTPAANLTIPAETMQSIQTQTSDELSISVFPTKIPETLPPEIDRNSLTGAVCVLVNNGDITTFNGKTLTIDIPVEDDFTENKTYKVLVISADGSSELLKGACIKGENGKYVQVTTTHLSVFIPMLDEQQDDVLIGDANGDGVINIFDAVRLKKYLAGMDVTISAGSDVTGDGNVNIFDAVRLQKYLAGMDVSLGK